MDVHEKVVPKFKEKLISEREQKWKHINNLYCKIIDRVCINRKIIVIIKVQILYKKAKTKIGSKKDFSHFIIVWNRKNNLTYLSLVWTSKTGKRGKEKMFIIYCYRKLVGVIDFWRKHQCDRKKGRFVENKLEGCWACVQFG